MIQIMQVNTVYLLDFTDQTLLGDWLALILMSDNIHEKSS